MPHHKRSRSMRRKGRRTSRRRRKQKGGIFPLAALLPALIARGKAVGLGALGGAALFGAKKRSDTITKRKR